MAIEIVDFPIKNGGSFHRYDSLPEGIETHAAFLSVPKLHTQPAGLVDAVAASPVASRRSQWTHLRKGETQQKQLLTVEVSQNPKMCFLYG